MAEAVEGVPQLPQFDIEAYHRTADLAAVWLPRLGGYDFKVNERLPEDGSAIITPKHTSMMDIPLVGLVTREAYDKYLRFVGKRELFEVPLLGNMIANYFYERGGIRLDRQVRLANQSAKEEIQQAIDDEEWVALFGEGTRRRDKAHERGRKVGKIKKGLAALAITNDLPIQVVGIAGTRHWYGHKVAVFGRVITPDQDRVDAEDPRSVTRYAKKLTEEVHSGMQDATDEAYRERDTKRVHIPSYPDQK